MKKLLVILGIITISGSGISGIVGNAPAWAKSEINYLQTNNLENLNRSKRFVTHILNDIPAIEQQDTYWCGPVIYHRCFAQCTIKKNIKKEKLIY